MSSAVLVLGGEPPAPEVLRAFAEQWPVYAADGGGKACLNAGVRPACVLGDLDSMDVSSIPEDWEVRHCPDQNQTDFEKLVAGLPEEIDSLMILGGLGGRLDHQWNNLLIAAAMPAQWRVAFAGGAERLVRVSSACPYESGGNGAGPVSLLPVGTVTGVSSSGLKWNLQGATLGAGRQLSQSNEVLTGDVRIEVAGGVLFVCVNQEITEALVRTSNLLH